MQRDLTQKVNNISDLKRDIHDHSQDDAIAHDLGDRKIKALEDEVATIKEKASKDEMVAQDYLSLLVREQDKIEQLKIDIDELKEKIEVQRKQFEGADITIRNLKEKSTKFESLYLETNSELETTKAELSSLKELEAREAKELQQLTVDHQTLQCQHTEAEKQVKDMTTELKQCHERITELEFREETFEKGAGRTIHVDPQQMPSKLVIDKTSSEFESCWNPVKWQEEISTKEQELAFKYEAGKRLKKQHAYKLKFKETSTQCQLLTQKQFAMEVKPIVEAQLRPLIEAEMREKLTPELSEVLTVSIREELQKEFDAMKEALEAK